jgi:hypothetical protein
MEIVLGTKILEGIRALDGRMPTETTPVPLNAGELQLILRAVQLVEAVREIAHKPGQ